MPKMNKTKYLKGECTECGGRLEFPAEAIGTSMECPHCGKTTELMLEVPKQEPILPTRVIVWTVIAVIILGGGLVGAILALKRAQRWAERQKEHSTPVSATTQAPAETTANADGSVVTNDFKVSQVRLEMTPGSSIVYAVGTAVNALNRQRFGVQIEVDLLNDAGQKIGSAKDYQQAMEPSGQWQFKALVMDAKATNARLGKITESSN